MTKTFRRIIIAAVAFIVVAAGASALVVTGGCSTAAGPLENTKNDAINAIIDASGIKEKIDAELRSKAGDIAEEMGIPQSVVETVVDSIAVTEWQATSLPADATETGSYTVEAEGTTAQITTYDDPSVVTIDAYGQSVTMAVPESAQGYVPYLQYIQYLQQ